MLRHRKQSLTALGTLALSFMAAPITHAAIINGSFEIEPDFTGWTVVGNTPVEASDFKQPVDGDLQGVISSGFGQMGSYAASTDVVGLNSFFNLAPGTLSGFNAKSGSGIKQTFSGQAGDTVSFAYDFLTNEGTNSDFAFYSLSLPLGGTVLVKLGDPSFPGLVATGQLDNLSGYFVRETGYQNGLFTLPQTGTYTLGFGAVNVGDTILPSGLIVDNVIQNSSSAVPLPTAVYPMSIGLAAMAAFGNRFGRRREQQAIAIGTGTGALV